MIQIQISCQTRYCICWECDGTHKCCKARKDERKQSSVHTGGCCCCLLAVLLRMLYMSSTVCCVTCVGLLLQFQLRTIFDVFDLFLFSFEPLPQK